MGLGNGSAGIAREILRVQTEQEIPVHQSDSENKKTCQQ